MIKKIWDKLINRETIAYLIAGVLTTIINIAIHFVLYQIANVPNLIANAIAWVVAVLFAYVVNDRFVFPTKRQGLQHEIKKFWKFILARLFSFGVDEVGMFIMVDLSNISALFSKVVMNVIVVVINYFFSKIFIFTSTESEEA